MKKIIVFLLIQIPFLLFSKSLWNERNLYHKQWKNGDILSLVFDRKQKIRFEVQRMDQDTLNVSGAKTSGKWIDFLPESSVQKNDRTKTARKTSIQEEDLLIIPVVIVAETNNQVFLEGEQTRRIFDKEIKISIKGRVLQSHIHSSGRLFSEDVAYLNYAISDGEENPIRFTNSGDLIFETNFLEIQTNRLLSTNWLSNFVIDTNGQTNLQIMTNLQTNMSFQTNPSQVELRLKGLSESKRHEILIKYLSAFLKLIK